MVRIIFLVFGNTHHYYICTCRGDPWRLCICVNFVNIVPSSWSYTQAVRTCFI